MELGISGERFSLIEHHLRRLLRTPALAPTFVVCKQWAVQPTWLHLPELQRPTSESYHEETCAEQGSRQRSWSTDSKKTGQISEKSQMFSLTSSFDMPILKTSAMIHTKTTSIYFMRTWRCPSTVNLPKHPGYNTVVHLRMRKKLYVLVVCVVLCFAFPCFAKGNPLACHGLPSFLPYCWHECCQCVCPVLGIAPCLCSSICSSFLNHQINRKPRPAGGKGLNQLDALRTLHLCTYTCGLVFGSFDQRTTHHRLNHALYEVALLVTISIVCRFVRWGRCLTNPSWVIECLNFRIFLTLLLSSL